MNRHKFQLDQQTVAFKIEQKIFDECNWPLYTDLRLRRRTDVAQGHKRASVNATDCRFDSSRKSNS